MTKKERFRRLEKITQGHYFQEKLTYEDLVLLLQEDPKVRDLICSLTLPVKSESSVAHCEVEHAEQPLRNEEMQRAQAPPGPTSSCSVAENFYMDLGDYRDFLRKVQDDPDLAHTWLLPEESEGHALVRVVALASQWSQVLELWDILASRCKKDGRGLTSNEQHLLEAAVGCYNLTLFTRQARLIWADTTTRYDYENHTRGTPQGDRIAATWLPGISNAAGNVQKKPLVATE